MKTNLLSSCKKGNLSQTLDESVIRRNEYGPFIKKKLCKIITHIIRNRARGIWTCYGRSSVIKLSSHVDQRERNNVINKPSQRKKRTANPTDNY